MRSTLRRREQRALRRLMPRRLLVLTVQGDESVPTYGVVNDISDCGAGIVADRLLPSGQCVRLRICFFPQVCLDTEARVVWGRDAWDGREGGHGLALNGVLFAGPQDVLALGPRETHEDRSDRDSVTAASLEYLECQVPNYPFDRKLDELFVAELLVDFPDVDLLEEIKTFRWYYASDPVARVPNPRVALRRWMCRSAARGRSRAESQNGRGNGSAFLTGETFGNWVSFLRA